MEMLRVVKKASLGSRLSKVSIHTEYTIKLGSHCNKAKTKYKGCNYHLAYDS